MRPDDELGREIESVFGRCEVMQRKFKIVNADVRKNAAQFVMSIQGKDEMEVVIRKMKKNKSEEQTSFLHVLLRIYADEYGNTEQQMKDIMIKDCWGTVDLEFNGKTYEARLSSKDLGMKDTAKLIQHIYVHAGENGIILPAAQRF